MDLFTAIEASLGFFLLVFIRISGLFIMAPVFGSRNIPAYIRAGIAFVISLVLFPMVFQANISLPDNMFIYAGMLFSELFVGWVIGFVCSLVFAGINMAGQMLDTSVGFGMIHVMDPQSGQQIPLIGNFKYILALIVFSYQ